MLTLPLRNRRRTGYAAGLRTANAAVAEQRRINAGADSRHVRNTVLLAPALCGARSRHVEAPIGRDPRNRLRMAVVENGKAASTAFELLQDAPGGCWVRATLQTGRTHQIRVHMAHIGHPLVADELYGGFPAAGMARQALHAYRLAFEHPVTGGLLEFHAPLPAELEDMLKRLRGK